MSFFLTVIGVVLIFEGMPWFLSPAGTKKFIATIHSLPEKKLRIYGLSAMIIGLILVRLTT